MHTTIYIYIYICRNRLFQSEGNIQEQFIITKSLARCPNFLLPFVGMLLRLLLGGTLPKCPVVGIPKVSARTTSATPSVFGNSKPLSFPIIGCRRAGVCWPSQDPRNAMLVCSFGLCLVLSHGFCHSFVIEDLIHNVQKKSCSKVRSKRNRARLQCRARMTRARCRSRRAPARLQCRASRARTRCSSRRSRDRQQCSHRLWFTRWCDRPIASLRASLMMPWSRLMLGLGSGSRLFLGLCSGNQDCCLARYRTFAFACFRICNLEILK